MKKIFKILGVIAILLLATVALLITSIDRTPYQETDYYKDWKRSIAEKKFLAKKTRTDSLYVGWSKVNITPTSPTPMAGYGKRKGELYTSVHDSIYVRTICVKVAEQSQFLISIDMLIVPPSVTELVKDQASDIGIPFENIYLSATHSHNSIGGWYNTLVGKLFAGPYDPAIEQMVAKAVVESISKAGQNLKPASIKYEENLDRNDIYNRLVREKGTIDPVIRSLKFMTASDSIILTTYAAHSTVIDASTMELSRDYPGMLVDELEKDGYAFASFMAGAVGSMGPREADGETDFEQISTLGNSVAIEINSKAEKASISSRMVTVSNFYNLLPLRKPSPKISPNWALRPWVFRWLFGDYPPYLKATKIGNTLMIGMPCDFSGELMSELDNYATSKGLNLIITSFNGAYAGYITADKYFDMENYETVTMSWYGPYNGAYFSEAARDIIDEMVQ